jgi:hypothetical protein
MANGLSGEWNLSLQPVLKGQALPRNLVVPPTTLKAGVKKMWPTFHRLPALPPSYYRYTNFQAPRSQRCTSAISACSAAESRFTRLMACPARPARAVRPTRCMYSTILVARVYLLTYLLHERPYDHAHLG